MPLYYLNDQGEAIIEDGKVYTRVGLVQGSPNDSAPDLANIGPFTYDSADPQGKSAYTAAERAVSRYLYGGTRSYSGTPYTVLFIATVSGVLRISGSNSTTWYHNNVSQGTLNSTSESEAYSKNIAVGDEIGWTNPGITAGLIYSLLPTNFSQSE